MQAKFHRYSFSNAMLILCQRPDATQVMGYGDRQRTTGWLSVGCQVNEGEKSIKIWAPSTRKVEAEEAIEEGSGKKAERETVTAST
jgi:hypothetical protein